jgi:hypothetical protein
VELSTILRVMGFLRKLIVSHCSHSSLRSGHSQPASMSSEEKLADLYGLSGVVVKKAHEEEIQELWAG